MKLQRDIECIFEKFLSFKLSLPSEGGKSKIGLSEATTSSTNGEDNISMGISALNIEEERQEDMRKIEELKRKKKWENEYNIYASAIREVFNEVKSIAKLYQLPGHALFETVESSTYLSSISTSEILGFIRTRSDFDAKHLDDDKDGQMTWYRELERQLLEKTN